MTQLSRDQRYDLAIRLNKNRDGGDADSAIIAERILAAGGDKIDVEKITDFLSVGGHFVEAALAEYQKSKERKRRNA